MHEGCYHARRMKPEDTRGRGQAGEDIAVRYLEAHGYRVLARNWRPAKESSSALRGEVDCIAWHGTTLCFVEVKARTSMVRGAPQQAVNSTKQRQLSHLANAYVSLHRLVDTPCRFDVVEVLLPIGTAPPRVALHQNAFDYIEDGRRTHRRGSRIF
jgi:putative endonuclease